jgi:hypothetical protein
MIIDPTPLFGYYPDSGAIADKLILVFTPACSAGVSACEFTGRLARCGFGCAVEIGDKTANSRSRK